MEKVSTARIALKWGLILGLISVAITIVYYTLGIMNPSWYGYLLSFSVYFGVLYLAMNEFKMLNDGFMKYGEGLGLGVLVFLTSAVIYSVCDFVYKNFIDPSIVKFQVSEIEKQYEKMGLSPEITEQAVEQFQSMANSPMGMLITIFTLVFFGLICSLIMSAFMRKNKPFFDL